MRRHRRYRDRGLLNPGGEHRMSGVRIDRGERRDESSLLAGCAGAMICLVTEMTYGQYSARGGQNLVPGYSRNRESGYVSSAAAQCREVHDDHAMVGAVPSFPTSRRPRGGGSGVKNTRPRTAWSSTRRDPPAAESHERAMVDARWTRSEVESAAGLEASTRRQRESSSRALEKVRSRWSCAEKD